MTQEKFEMLQEEMTNVELIDLAEKQVSQLAKTGMRSAFGYTMLGVCKNLIL